MKNDITKKCAEFVCKDIRPFETVAGAGFAQLAQAFVDVGVKYGHISVTDIIPHPTTVSRKVSEVASSLKDDVVKPQLHACLNKWGGAVTTDMWTESYTQTSYITVTVHYITDEWVLMERVLATREFSPDLRHTGENINQAVSSILAEFEVDANKVVCVTDRGANVLAAMKDRKHISCCDHMINTVPTHLFNNDSMDDCPRLRSMLTGAKELVRFFKKSGLMKHLSTPLKQEVSTRWNTMFYLLESVQTSFDEIDHILRTRGEGYRLAGIDKELLNETVNFLEVFRVASVELEASKKPTLHLALPWFYKMIQHCREGSAASAEMASVKHKARALLQSKFLLQPLHQVAAVLNPKMKTMKMLPDDEKQDIYNALRRMVLLLPEQQHDECKSVIPF